MKRTKTPASPTKIVAAAGAGVCALALAGCSIGPVNLSFLDKYVTSTTVSEAKAQRQEDHANAVEASELLEAGTLTIGYKSTDTAPLVVSNSDGTVTGIDIELGYAVAEQMGLKAKFVSVSDTSAIGTKCDVLVGCTSSDAGSYVVLGDYAEDAVTVFGKNVSGTISSSDLAGKTVAVQAGSASQRLVTKLGLDVTQTNFTSLNDAFSALDSGSVDYVVCGAYSGGYLAAVYDNIGVAATLETPTAIGVAVDTSKATLTTALSSAVEKVQTGGQLDVIKSRWVGGMQTLTTASQLMDLANLNAVANAGLEDGAESSQSESATD